jgi:hypothetical protein
MTEKRTMSTITDPKLKRNLAILRSEFTPKRSGDFYNDTYSTGSAAPDESTSGAFKRGTAKQKVRRER